MYMDDIRLSLKNEKELETPIHTVRIYSPGIRMEYGIEKCAMLVMKRGKRHLTGRMELTNQDKIRTLGEKETCYYLGILEAATIKQVDMKEKLRNSILGEPESYSRQNYVTENKINTWPVSHVRYSGPFLKWTREELR